MSSPTFYTQPVPFCVGHREDSAFSFSFKHDFGGDMRSRSQSSFQKNLKCNIYLCAGTKCTYIQWI
ncbi:hypothetical protein AOLI_G00248710 [Acnodon oligacanthus]